MDVTMLSQIVEKLLEESRQQQEAIDALRLDCESLAQAVYEVTIDRKESAQHHLRAIEERQ